MLLALGLDQLQPRRRGEQVGGGGVDEGHRVDLAGLQRGGAGVHVGDAARLDLVEPGAAFLPVVRKALDLAADTRLIAFQRIAAGADALVELGVARGHDQQVHEAHQRREARIRRGQRDRDLARRGRLDPGDLGQQRLGLGDGLFAAMQVDRIDHVLGIQRLARCGIRHRGGS